MNHCKCKIDFKMNNSSLGEFEKDRWYRYVKTKHEETGMTIYHVGDTKYELDDEFLSFSSVPFTDVKFNQFFDDIQQERENKLNQILK